MCLLKREQFVYVIIAFIVMEWLNHTYFYPTTLKQEAFAIDASCILWQYYLRKQMQELQKSFSIWHLTPFAKWQNFNVSMVPMYSELYTGCNKLLGNWPTCFWHHTFCFSISISHETCLTCQSHLSLDHHDIHHRHLHTYHHHDPVCGQDLWHVQQSA